MRWKGSVSPAVAVPAASPAAAPSKLRFAEDVLPQGHTDPGIKTRAEAEEAAEKAKRSRKPRRLRPEEEEDDDQLDYAVPADDDASLGGAHDFLGYLREAGQDAVDLPCHRHQRLLAGVGGDDELGAAGCKHLTLGFYRGPHVVRDKDS